MRTTNKWKQYGPIEWLWQVVLLHMETKLPHLTIRELAAKNCRGPYHELLETGEAITACDVVPFQKSTPLYIPCHTKCVYIAKRVFAASDVGIEDGMKHLWYILEARFQEASDDSIQPVTNIHSGLEHSNIRRFQGLEWEPDPEHDEPEETFESDVSTLCSQYLAVLTASSIL
ncbi:hypothetical protein N7G274_010174 [Stereocaulon virgatum]|uniref:Uncharacterized protein n=1 Tax=Stereocaulon virgatum TaxID=373712 RepID=A0ABR3ZU17_9LECA